MRLFVLTLLLTACGSARPTITDPRAAGRGQLLALRAARAHGGLQRFRALGGVSVRIRASDPFDLYPKDGAYLLDPARNRALVRFWGPSGPVEWRYDGRRAVILERAAGEEQARCTGTPRAREQVAGLLSTTLFWFGVPFKFLDEGAQPVDAGPSRSGEPRLLVTYSGVGDTPDDWYLVTLDPTTLRIRKMIYIASALTRRLEFEADWRGYRSFEGLPVATHRTFSPKRTALRGLGPAATTELSDVVTSLPVDDRWFAPPAGCISE